MISEQQNTTEGRLVSVDALRGLTMFWIIGGAELLRTLARVWPNHITRIIGQQMSHLNYGGFRFYDLIFPMFLFVVGIVLPFSVSRRLSEGQSRIQVHLHIAKRAGLLILLGLIRDAGLLTFDRSEMWSWGVLSLIGVAYFIAAVIVLNTTIKIQALVTAGLLLGYWGALALIGIKIPDNHKTLPSALSMYFAFSSAGAANALIGVLAGHWLRSGSGSWKSAGLAIAGLLSLIIGYAWGVFFPVIRLLWTSSYVLVACGYSLLLLAAFYRIIEVKQCRKWAFFFVVIGMNSITIYMLQKFVDFNEITRFFLQGIVKRAGTVGPIIMACGVLAVKWLLLWFLYRHKIFFKV
jgi:predicted acyltransferase